MRRAEHDELRWALNRRKEQILGTLRITEAIEIHAPDEMLNVNRPAVR